MSQLQVRDEQGKGIFHANIRIALGHQSSDEAIFDILTDPSGNQGWPIPFWPSRDYTLHVNKRDVLPGYGEAEVYVEAGDHDVPVILPHAPPTGGQSGFLRINGREIVTEDGQPWCLAGYAIYTLISSVKKGQDIGPLFDEAIGYGANTIVALSMDLGDWAKQNGFAVDPRDPRWPGWLATVFDVAASKQMRVALGVFQQAGSLGTSEQQAVWTSACNVMRGRWNAIARLGNESNVNGWDPSRFARPALSGVLCTTGSRGIGNAPGGPQWNIIEWEPRRDPVYKAMDDAGSGALEIQDGQPGCPTFNGPIFIIEPPFFNNVSPDGWGDTRWTDPKLALRLGGEIGVNTSGGVYGDSACLIGQPSSTPECARAFFRGLWAGFVR
jgi:hypothetical protein